MAGGKIICPSSVLAFVQVPLGYGQDREGRSTNPIWVQPVMKMCWSMCWQVIAETDPAMILSKVLLFLGALEKEGYVSGELLVCVICSLWPLVFADV
jgi:hypothetical protein